MLKSSAKSGICQRSIFSPKNLMIVLAFSFSANSAAALDITQDTRSDRYSLERQGDRFIRLDRQTGEISNCAFERADLVCRLAVEERNALTRELDRLSLRIEELERNLARGADTSSEDHPGLNPQLPKIPKSDEQLDGEFERALDYTTKALRRFYTMMKDLRKDLENESN